MFLPAIQRSSTKALPCSWSLMFLLRPPSIRRVLDFTSDPGTETPEYTVVWRDNAALHLTRGEHAPMGVRIFFWVRDVNALYEEVIRRGVAIDVPIETRPNRVRDFSIRDPNGVVVVLGQDWD